MYGTFVVGSEGETLGYTSPFEGEFTDVPQPSKWVPAVLASGPDGSYIAYPPTVPVSARAAGSSPISAAGVASPFMSAYSPSSAAGVATPYSFSPTSPTETTVYKGGTVGAHRRSAIKSGESSSQLEKRIVFNPENPFSVRPSHELPSYDDWVSKRSPDGRLQAPAQPEKSNYRSYAMDHGDIKVVDLPKPVETAEQARERKEKMSLEEINKLIEAERLENERKRHESDKERKIRAREKHQRKLAALTRDEDKILGDTGFKDIAGTKKEKKDEPEVKKPSTINLQP